MRDGVCKLERLLWNGGDVIPVQREDSEVGQPREGLWLDALDVVVAHDERGQAGEVGEQTRGDHSHAVVGKITEYKEINFMSSKAAFQSVDLQPRQDSKVADPLCVDGLYLVRV